jgi:hypothetical protein
MLNAPWLRSPPQHRLRIEVESIEVRILLVKVVRKQVVRKQAGSDPAYWAKQEEEGRNAAETALQVASVLGKPDERRACEILAAHRIRRDHLHRVRLSALAGSAVHRMTAAKALHAHLGPTVASAANTRLPHSSRFEPSASHLTRIAQVSIIRTT